MRNYNKYKKYWKKKKTYNPIKITIMMIILIIIMSLGYAQFTDILSISGTANLGTFTITYNLNGGTNPQNPITTYDATMQAPLPIPTKTNYIFDGWYDNSGLSGESISSTPTRAKCQKFRSICKMDNSR